MRQPHDKQHDVHEDRVSAIEGIRRGLESAARGEGIPLEEFERKMRERLRNLPVRRPPHKR